MISSFTFSISLSFFFFIIRIFNTEAAPTYLYHNCSNTTTNGFANDTAGQNTPDQAYGLFLCRGDLNTATCSDCVATGKQEILQRCPNQRVSVIWYDQCVLRYSDQSIFSVMEREPSPILFSPGNVPDTTQLMDVLLKTMSNIIANASAGGSGKKFAAAEANITSLRKLYALSQCTPDLTEWDCNACLQFASGYLVQGKQGGRVLTPSCNVRYEFYPFYNTSALLVPAPPPRAPVSAPPPPAPVTGPKGKSNKSTVIAIAITVPVGVVMVLLFLTCCLLGGKKMDEVVERNNDANELTTMESLQFDLATIQAATNDFSSENKLGEGGFGEVFQGRLLDGQQIAVKRLSRSSRQGDDEFKNEVLLVAKLQHRNLVRLLRFCLEGDEKLLIYEFVPNKSLDYFLFDPQKSNQLNWSLRYKIVYGIARGMLYLHKDSRLRIIHRDLKCSNILLDNEMNPKISDFGMARIFGVNQTQASTNKIVGTFGYMSLEYAMHGEFSVKSDVYSFGILLIEIICGKKNNFYHHLDGGGYLASYVWNKWRDGTPLKVLDPAIVDSYSRDEVLRCLHIGLLCIQEDPAIRPTMTTVVLMLSSNYFNPPSPQHPAFFIRSRSGRLSIPMKELGSNRSTSRTLPSSTNDMSVTELYPR
ncbi:hypothetical protein ACJRO7_021797 [Eucalyptus globulus]|uniref:Cysteine-rich receptor-like protein kinase 10 n=1 Tax=Eucalyptus globulus TaxID=34317 RepID=A0ABD3KMN6_EUCGL